MDAAPGRLHRGFYRNGPSHRDGADVSFSDIVKIFSFKTVSIGKWVSTEEQQLAANLFFDALCDMMDILQVPERVISLNGSLSLAFGKGGSKHSSAHYDANSRTLALAKNAGGGALAHEWFHAFDHYICRRMFPAAQSQDFASELWLSKAIGDDHPLNLRLDRFFELLFITRGAPNDYVCRALAVDKALNSQYYARPQELAARAFEALVQDHRLKNQFLASGTKQSQEAKLGLYPSPALLSQLGPVLWDYFALLGQALEARS